MRGSDFQLFYYRNNLGYLIFSVCEIRILSSLNTDYTPVNLPACQTPIVLEKEVTIKRIKRLGVNMKKGIILLLITAVLVAILLSQIKAGAILTTIAGISPRWILLGFALYVLTYFLRALRFNILLNGKVSIRDLFSIVSVHNMMNSLLPARTGELSYVYLLKKTKDVPSGEGVTTLLVARSLDIIAVSIIFLISIFFIEGFATSRIILAPITLILLAIFVLFLSIYHGAKMASLIGELTLRIGISESRSIAFLLKKIDETAKSFQAIDSNKLLFKVFAVTILSWTFQFSVVYTLIAGMGIPLNLLEVIVGATFAMLTFILPISSLAGFGTLEGAWAIAVMSLGITKEAAIISGFGFHIILLIFSMILGGYGVASMEIRFHFRTQ